MTDTRLPASRRGGGTLVPSPVAERGAGRSPRADPSGGGANSRAARGEYPHPLTWWIWAGALALALTRVDNPLVVVLTIGALIVTTFACREPRGAGNLFSTTFTIALVIGGVIVVVRTGFYLLLGLPDSSPVILELPTVPLPWLTNLKLLGPVHVQGLVGAITQGVRLAGLVIAFGAASALSNPRRALRFLPSSLHHLGTAAVIAVAGAPQLVESAARVRRAQRLRAPAAPETSRLGGLSAIIVPVLSGALDHALILAGSMDSRGYARARSSPRGVGAALVLALLAGAAGTYGLLDSTSSPTTGVTLLLGGFALAVGASIISGRAVARSRYFTPSWTWRQNVITAGAMLIVTATIAGTWNVSGLGPWRVGSGWPPLPLTGVLIVAGALLPAVTRVGRRS